eukprot:1645333-Pyramimonas_sp.AAC.1
MTSSRVIPAASWRGRSDLRSLSFSTTSSFAPARADAIRASLIGCGSQVEPNRTTRFPGPA